MRRLARSLVSTLTTRRLLSLVGLAFYSELELRQAEAEDFRSRMWMAQEGLEQGKRQWRLERAQFREAMNIRGAHMAQHYRLCVENCEPTAEIHHRVFRFDLRPVQYYLHYAPIDHEVYKVPMVRKMFAEQTAHEFSKYILEHLPAEVEKQLEAQL
jgi:hypothetical protein